MTPLEKYQADLTRPEFVRDPAQEQAVRALDHLYQKLCQARAPAGLLAKLRKQKRQPEKGLYMWGGVGRGKTYLMDIFFECLPFEEKRRMHFHRFMQKVHRQMRERQGEKTRSPTSPGNSPPATGCCASTSSSSPTSPTP